MDLYRVAVLVLIVLICGTCRADSATVPQSCAQAAPNPESIELTLTYRGEPFANQPIVLSYVEEGMGRDNGDARPAPGEDQIARGTTDAAGKVTIGKLYKGAYDVCTSLEHEMSTRQGLLLNVYRRPVHPGKDSAATIELEVPGCTLFDVAKPERPDFHLIEIRLWPLSHTGADLWCRSYSGLVNVGYVRTGRWRVECHWKHSGSPDRQLRQTAEIVIPPGREFSYRPSLKTYKVSGTVKVPKEFDRFGGEVKIEELAGNGGYSGRYDLSGKFELADVLEGEYSASAFAKANKLEQFSNSKTISVTKDLKGVVIDFSSRVGKIAYSQKLPEGFTRPAVNDVSMRLLDSKGAPIDPRLSRPQTMNLGYVDVPAGSYLLEASGCWIRTVTTKVTVKAGLTSEVEIILQPVAWCEIEISSLHRPATEAQFVVEDSQGKALPATGSGTVKFGQAMGTESKCRFVVHALPENAVRIRIIAPGCKEVVLDVDPKPKKRIELKCALDKAP